MRSGHVMRPREAALAILCSACLLITATATAGNPEADAMFNKGLKAMLAGDFDEGCPAIARSDELDPTAGTVFTLAECYAKWGKATLALKKYQEYLGRYTSLSPDDREAQTDRHEIAVKQIDALQASLPRLELSGIDALPSGAKITLDGKTLGSSTLSQPILIGEGEHVLRITGDGITPQKHKFSGAVGDVARIDVTPTEESGADGDWTGWQTAAVISGSIGVAGLLVGTIAGGVMLSQKGTLEDNCADTACNREGKDAADSAQGAGNVSSAGWVIGLVGIAAGVTLWFLAPDGDESDADDASNFLVTPVVTGSAGLLMIEGAF